MNAFQVDLVNDEDQTRVNILYANTLPKLIQELSKLRLQIESIIDGELTAIGSTLEIWYGELPD